MRAYEQGSIQSDKEFVNRILNRDEDAWADFVVHYTDWVHYKATEWTRKTQELGIKPEKGGEYTDQIQDQYLWIFQQLRKRLHTYRGECSLSTYIWTILNSPNFRTDWLRQRYSNPHSLPKVIQKCSKKEQKVFVLLRMKKSVERVAQQLDLEVKEVCLIKEKLIEKLFKTGLEDLLLHPTEIEIKGNLKCILSLPASISGEDRILLEKVIERFSKSLEKLSPEEIMLLQMFFDDKLSATEILQAHKRINKNLPNNKAIQEATSKDIYKVIEKIRERLLEFFRLECQDLREVIINNNTVNEFLDQLGARLQ